MESQRGLRRRRALGPQQDEDRIPTVRISLLREGDVEAHCLGRFFVNKKIQDFADAIVQKHGGSNEEAFLFPSHAVASRCVAFFRSQASLVDPQKSLRILDLYPNSNLLEEEPRSTGSRPIISAVIFPRDQLKIVKTFWQHSGDGISSRRAEYCHKAYDDGHLAARSSINENGEEPVLCKGPRRYQKNPSVDIRPVSRDEQVDGKDYVQFVEERFGRNLDVSMATNAKQAVRKRIAGALSANVDLPEVLSVKNPPQRTDRVKNFSEDDVYLYPCGMSSIFNTHRTLMACKGEMKSISFGFPYIDTLKILQKWGPGCLFYGHGASVDLDDLQRRCESGERFLALFCEFPGNPLLKTPDLQRIRTLADRHDFAVVIDETIGNFINVDVLPYADVVVSSLTKVFTGECNVMGGSAVLNPQRRYYSSLKAILKADYEDNYWPEDALFMERNSRDFVSRIQRINSNAEAICDTLKASPIVKEVFYPKYSPSRIFYDNCRNENGGYGGLLSVTFKTSEQAVTFFDKLDTAKGPSLGTNFTLSSPYVVLAHYAELDWVKQFGVDPDLVRISAGLEDSGDLCAKVDRALVAATEIVAG